LTIRKWIADDIIPRPILSDTDRGYMQFSEGELQIIAELLSKHEEEYDYVHYTHTTFIHSLFQRVEAYRKLNI